MSWVGLLSLLGLVLLLTLPESPRWLVQQQDRHEAAVSLRTLRQSSIIEAELDEIVRQEATIGAADVSMSVLFTSPRFRWPIVTSIALNAVQQLSGINTVILELRSVMISMISCRLLAGVLLLGKHLREYWLSGGEELLGHSLDRAGQPRCHRGGGAVGRILWTSPSDSQFTVGHHRDHGSLVHFHRAEHQWVIFS